MSVLRGKRSLRCLARALAALGLSALTGACATTTKGKVAEWTVLGGLAGGAYGSSRPEYKDQNAVMYGAVGAAIGALAAVYYHDPDKQTEQLRLENAKLKKDLDAFSEPKVLVETPATFNSRIPEKYKRLINPGEWRVAEIDQWIEDGENRLIHQDKVMELIPPSLKPNQQGNLK